ncbi:hypothetical protein [Nocardioides litoris]|uniref:hypothetical protein n=1 Tax=Nocardioides litoris TaxID=1926648 RepID=UPI001477571B|nr:hypothetical protein [Nocardioides litoris]
MTDHPPPGPPPPGPPPPGAPPAPAHAAGGPSRWVVPPAYAAPGAPAPGPAGGPPPGWAPPRGMLGAAHKPGAMPLRPLTLGEMYDAAFRIIRFNPKATVGAAVLVAAVTMAVPVLVTTLLTWTVGLAYDPAAPIGETGTGDDLGSAAALGSLGLGIVLQGLGLVLVTGMIVHVTAAAAVGRRLSLGEAWAATHGRRWRLVGLTLLLGLATTVIITVYVLACVLVAVSAPTVAAVVVIIVSVPVFVAFLLWFWIKVYYLPVPPLMLERLGVLASIGRGYRLTRGSFWRVLGIALLTLLIGSFAGQILGTPFSLLSAFGSLAVPADYTLLVTVVGSALAQVATTAFVAPFASTVTSLQYLDQRMRLEGYDVELMRQAGILER